MRSLGPYLLMFAVAIAAWSFALGQAVNSYSPRESRLGPVTEVHRNPLDTCQTLADSIACWGIPFPDVFARIAFIETGNGTAGVGQLNNLFGMRCHNRATQDSCHHSGYGVYAAREDAIADLALWVQYSPALPGETAYEYLLRRGWQPRAWMPKYWQALQSLNH